MFVLLVFLLLSLLVLRSEFYFDGSGVVSSSNFS